MIKYLEHDIVDIPSSGFYIPVTLYTPKWSHNNGMYTFWTETRKMAIIPAEGENVEGTHFSKIGDNLFCKVVIPLPKDDGKWWKMSKIFPDTYAEQRAFSIEGKYDFSGTNDFSEMFKGCAAMTSMPVHSFFFAGATDLHELCAGCSSLKEAEIEVKTIACLLNRELHAERLKDMFKGCESLKKVTIRYGGELNPEAVTAENLGCPATTQIVLAS